MAEDPTLVAIETTVRNLPTPQQAFSWYRHLVEDTEQAEPMLVIGSRKGTVLLPLTGWDRVGDGVRAAAVAARKNGFVPTWLLVSAEAWRRSYPNNDEASAAAERLRHGDLEKAASLGDPRVEEIVSMTGMTRGGRGYLAVVPFTRTPEGVVWAPLEAFDLSDPAHNQLSGEVITTIAAVFGRN